jgi:DNA adenine methylase
MGSCYAGAGRDMEVSRQQPRRAGHRYSPLRYPGGKAKLAGFVKLVLETNSLEDGIYVEPFAGGAGLAFELLLQGYVSRVALNDVSFAIFAFWSAVLRQPTRFVDKILEVPLTIEQWEAERRIFLAADLSDPFALGFAAFYLNRTNRSGVLNGGVIGGKQQTGKWLIDARFNRDELAGRVERISRVSSCVELSCLDAVKFIQRGHRTWSKQTFIYADPPYFVKGRQLYYDYYSPEDHRRLARLFCSELGTRYWMVSYDNVPEVRRIYSQQQDQQYYIPYSLRNVGLGSEIMFYSASVLLPEDSDTGKPVLPAARFDHQAGALNPTSPALRPASAPNAA